MFGGRRVKYDKVYMRNARLVKSNTTADLWIAAVWGVQLSLMACVQSQVESRRHWKVRQGKTEQGKAEQGKVNT